VVLLALLAGHAQARAPSMKRLKDAAGGKHWRITVPGKGPVHVWIPAGYQRRRAGLVVYVHGYWTDPDGAWRDHDLAKQFRKSKQQAMFIVPASPKGPKDAVSWPELGTLKQAIRSAGMRLPTGPVVAFAHSGAYRTVEKWVDNASLSQMILIDGFYGNEQPWDAFISSGPNVGRHKLVLIGKETHARAHRFTRARKGRRLERLPTRYEDFSRRDRRARLLYMKSQYSHMALIKGGEALPLLLRLTPLRRMP
jgi:hypothetical protein